jgi:hypothetical protein
MIYWVWWHMSIILALGSLRLDDLEFKDSLGYIVRYCLKNILIYRNLTLNNRFKKRDGCRGSLTHGKAPKDVWKRIINTCYAYLSKVLRYSDGLRVCEMLYKCQSTLNLRY